MGYRYPGTVADVAWARPAVIPDDLIMNYSGPAFCGLDQVKAWGKPYLLGYESSTTRAYAGGGAAIPDAQQLLGVARTLPGYIESGCGFWFCAADTPNSPDHVLGWIREYGAEFARQIHAVCGVVPILAYGNRAAASAACAGIADAGGRPYPWGVGTWGYGEGGAPNSGPSESDAALVQSGNTPGRAEGTDLNWRYVDLAELRPYGLDVAAAPPVTVGTNEGDEMELIAATSDGPVSWTGAQRVRKGNAYLFLGDSVLEVPVTQWYGQTGPGLAFPRGLSAAMPGAQIEALWTDKDRTRGFIPKAA